MNYSGLSRLQNPKKGKLNTKIVDSESTDKSALSKMFDGVEFESKDKKLKITDSLIEQVSNLERKKRRLFLSRVSAVERKNILIGLKALNDSINANEKRIQDKLDLSLKFDLKNIKTLIDSYYVTGDESILEDLDKYSKDNLSDDMKEYLDFVLDNKLVSSELWNKIVAEYRDQGLRAPLNPETDTIEIEDSAIDKIINSDFIDPTTGEEVSQEDAPILERFVESLSSFIQTGKAEALETIFEELNGGEESTEPEEEEEDKVTDSIKKLSGYLSRKKIYDSAELEACCEQLSPVYKVPISFAPYFPVEITTGEPTNIIQVPINKEEYRSIDKSIKSKIIGQACNRYHSPYLYNTKEVKVVGDIVEVTLINNDIQYWEVISDLDIFLENLQKCATDYDKEYLIGQNCVHLGEKQRFAASINELDLVSDEFYKTNLTDQHWFIDNKVSSIKFEGADVEIKEKSIVSPLPFSTTNQTVVYILGTPYFLYLPE